MNIPFVDLKAQYQSIKAEIDEAMAEVLNQTAFIGGKPVAKFKSDFENAYGIKHCVPCANGTDALYIAMRMMGIGKGDEVITTASTWISTSETISQTEATPVFVDVDEFFTIDASKLEEKITSRTKLIIPVHLYGQVADMPKIMEVANRHGLRVLEDCAQSHFSELHGTRAGHWGDAATFSFYPGKNLGAYGDAGCLITNDDELATQCRIFSNHGAEKKHHHLMEGINSRMDGIQAAVLSVKLRHIHQWTEARIKASERYRAYLQDVKDIILPALRPGTRHTFHVFGILTNKRQELKTFLAENGVNTQIHYPKALPFMPAYKHLGASPEDYPNAYNLQEKELSLPIFPEVTEEQIAYTCGMIRDFFN